MTRFTFNNDTREEIARIITEMVADGLEHPRHLDAGLDAIESAVQFQIGEPNGYVWSHSLRSVTYGLGLIDTSEGLLIPVYTFPDQVD